MNGQSSTPMMTSYSIGQLLGDIENSSFVYTIPTTRRLDNDLTEDQLHRHIIGEFERLHLKSNGYDVKCVGDRQFLSLTVKVDEENLDSGVFTWDEFPEDYYDWPVTPQTVMTAFGAERFLLPKSFVD